MSLPAVYFPIDVLPSEYKLWHPSHLQEWAKAGHSGTEYILALSGVDHLALSDIPGGPFEMVIDGANFHGHDGLRTLLAEWYGTTPEHILLAQGASLCNFLIAGAVLSSGGEAIVEAPNYEPILRSVQVWASKVHQLPRRPENNYLPDLAELKKLLTPNVKLLCLTNLHNPSHVRIFPSQLKAIIDHCHDRNVHVMIDEVFLSFIERDHRHHGFASGAISINSFDKAWGISNLRVGWAAGPPAIIEKAYRLNNLLGVNQPYLTEHLAYQILRSDTARNFMIDRANHAMSGKKYLDEFLAATPEVTCTPPAGGLSAWLKLPNQLDDRDVVKRLVERYSTLCFPGFLYGAPGHIRVSFGSDPARTREGFHRLHQCIRSF